MCIRDSINRHHYPRAEIDEALERPVVQRLCELIRLRNTHPAFNGRFELLDTPDDQLALRWQHQGRSVTLRVDLKAGRAQIDAD